MARYSFGGQFHHLVVAPDANNANALKIAPGLAVPLFLAPGGAAATDFWLYDPDTLTYRLPVTTIVGTAGGYLPLFQGPDGVESLWMQASDATWVELRTNDVTAGQVTGGVTWATLEGRPARIAAGATAAEARWAIGAAAAANPTGLALQLRSEWAARARETLPGAYIGATSATGAATSIAGAVDTTFYDRTAQRVRPNFRVTQCSPVQAGTATPAWDAIRPSGITSPTVELSMSVEFDTSGDDDLEVRWIGDGPSAAIRVWVDEMHVGTIPGSATADGLTRRTVIKLPTVGTHAVRLVTARGGQLLAIAALSGMLLQYPKRHKGARIIVAGDGYVEGDGASSGFNSIPALLSGLLDRPDVWASGVSGTGYYFGGDSGNEISLLERFESDVIARSPQFVVFIAGTEEAGHTGVARTSIVDAAISCWDSALLLQNIVPIVVGPLRAANEEAVALNGELRAAAEHRGVYYIDALDEGWLEGTRWASTYLAGAMPSDHGYFYLACMIAAHITSALKGDVSVQAADFFHNPPLAGGSNPVLAPVNTTVPAITGTPQVAQTLTLSNGVWTNSPTDFIRQWRANGALIPGASGLQYTLTTAEQGKTITGTVTAVNASGSSAPATSAATAAVTAAATTLWSAGVPGYTFRHVADDLPASGAAIASWPARAGAPLVGPAGAEPVVAVSGSQKMARTDGISEHLSLAASTGLGTVAVVIRHRAAAGTAQPVMATGGGDILRRAIGGTAGSFVGGSSVAVTNDLTNQFRVVFLVGMSTTRVMQIDGQTVTLAGTGTNTAIQLGRNSTGSLFGSVDVLEVIGYAAALTADQRAAVRNAMFDHYGAGFLTDPSLDGGGGGGGGGATQGVWINSAEIASIPASGAAWDRMVSAANAAWGSPNLGDLNSTHDTSTLAGALVGVRTSNQTMIDKTRNSISSVKNTTFDRVLELSRGIVSYVVAADIIGYRDPAWLAFVESLRTKALTGHSGGSNLKETALFSANNWGTMARGAMAAIDVYLGTHSADLTATARTHREWMGEDVAGFTHALDYGTTGWHAHNPKVGVNRRGATIDGHPVGGVLPEDQRRTGEAFQWPAPKGSYPWEALQGAVVAGRILDRAGLCPFNAGDSALIRAAEWLTNVNANPAVGDDRNTIFILRSYGSTLSAPSDNQAAKNMAWSDWTK